MGVNMNTEGQTLLTMSCIWSKRRVIRAILGLIILANSWAFIVWFLDVPVCLNLIVGSSLGIAYSQLVHYFWPLWRFDS